MLMTIIKPQPGARRIKFHIPYESMEWRKAVKLLPTRKYHKQQQLWSIYNDKALVGKLKAISNGNYEMKENGDSIKKFQYKPLSESHQSILASYEQKLVLKGYSSSTIKNYKISFTKFLVYFSTKEIAKLTKEDLEKYLYHLIIDYKISESKQNVVINALKFYYEKILLRPRTKYDLQRPKNPKSLPDTLSDKEVVKLLNAPTNLKHKCILYLLYSAGIRVNEVTKIRIQDINKDESTIFIKGAKGKKDRKTILAQILLEELRVYYVEYKPAYWLFEGQDGGQYSKSSIQKLFRNAVKSSGINQWATPHILRHSFATHLMQNGVNLRYIQTLLGHSSPKTTEIYTHVIKVNNRVVLSPLDKILGEKTKGQSRQ